MTDIVTLTLNPSIDASTSVQRVVPFQKLRCMAVHRDPGGGGINAARVMRRLGADVTAIYSAGGALGQLLRRLVDQEGIPGLTIPIAEETREDFTVIEATTGQQFRFILPGPRLAEHEWRAGLDAVLSLERRARFVVASGSLPPGVPDDFYGRLAHATKEAGSKIIVDTSGPALKAALQAGVYLVKPSLQELQGLVGKPVEGESDWITACRGIIESKQAEIVALTLGEQGALLVTPHEVLRAPALPIKPVSVVGAGDSFLGAMVWALASGRSIQDAFRYGVAAGSAAVLMPGTELCQRADVERLVHDVKLEVR